MVAVEEVAVGAGNDGDSVSLCLVLLERLEDEIEVLTDIGSGFAMQPSIHVHPSNIQHIHTFYL